MDIGILYRYVLLDRTKSLTRAAELAYMSRQAYTDSLTKLEDELGVKLLERRRRGFELTAAGEELLRYLKKWLPEWEAELNTLSNLENREKKTIHIGVSFAELSPVFLERMVRFEALHRSIRVEYQDYSPQECLSLLDECSIDVVCMLDCGERPGCLRARLPESGTQPLLMMHKSHPLAQKEEITTADLKGVRMVMGNNSMKPDPLLDQYAKPFGAIPLYVPIRNNSYALSIMRERNAVGLSTSRRPNRYEKDGFVTRPIIDYPMGLSCYVYYKESAPSVVKEFVAFFVNR